MALFALVNDRYLESLRGDFTGTLEWIDVVTDEVVTLQDLLVLLSAKI